MSPPQVDWEAVTAEAVELLSTYVRIGHDEPAGQRNRCLRLAGRGA